MGRGPDFLICGGQRCGSTSLANALDKHPDVFVAKPWNPEPKYFINDDCSDNSFERYKEDWFSECDAFKVVGEKSTSYLDVPDTAKRIYRFLPSVKLVFVFRHPIERAISNYLFSKSNGLENLSADEAFLNEVSRLEISTAVASVHPHGYLKRSSYLLSIQQYLNVFSRDQMHFVKFDDLVREFDQTVHCVFSFLGVSAKQNHQYSTSANKGDWSNFQIQKDTLDFLFSYFSPFNEELGQLIGKDLSNWNNESPLITDFGRVTDAN